MYNTFFSEEHHLFRQSLREFLEKEVKPHVDEYEEQRHIPKSVYKRFGEMGYFGMSFPEEYGGMGLDIFYHVIFAEEMARMNSGGLNAALGSHFGLALVHLNAEGSEAQKQKYLVPGIKGDTIGCLAITEPFGGSDVAAMRTTAVREGDEWIINGSKTFITNGVTSDFLVVAAKTDPAAKAKGVSLFIIDRNTPGVSATKLKKLGWHASDTGEIAFDDVRIPADNLLGEENRGFLYIMQHFASERLMMAFGGVATADYAMECTLKYMDEREAFGRKIKKFQVLRHRIAQMAAEIEMNRAFSYSLCRRYQDGDYVVKEAAMAKLLATQLSDKVAYECLQMFGGYGFMEAYPLARMFRDSRLGPIGGGTSEILCEIISKMMIDAKGYKKAVAH
ncbi:MAG: acyl-CoA dehydrogenase family protein [Bacteroidota bacterium]